MSWGKDTKKIDQAKELFETDPKKAFELLEEDAEKVTPVALKIHEVSLTQNAVDESLHRIKILIQNIPLLKRTSGNIPPAELRRYRADFDSAVKILELAKDAYIELSQEMNKL